MDERQSTLPAPFLGTPVPPFGQPAVEWRLGDILISTDPGRLDLPLIHDFLANRSYWAKGIPLEIVRRSIAGCIPFGVYERGGQVGFARMVTDCATFAWLGDVFILETHRGRGLSKRLVEAIRAHPGLQGQRRWLLATWEAAGLYEQVGFRPLARPERFMELHNPDVYANAGG